MLDTTGIDLGRRAIPVELRPGPNPPDHWFGGFGRLPFLRI
jgi:hypothetical protein